jgi:hypothetical protein
MRDTIEMAQATLMRDKIGFWAASVEQLQEFADLVRADEREACAKVCEPQEEHDDPLTAWKIAAAIRARGETK